MTGHEWITAFAQALGVDAPPEDLIDDLLALAGEAAHASERIAAPITCYLVGAGGAGGEPPPPAAPTVSPPGQGKTSHDDDRHPDRDPPGRRRAAVGRHRRRLAP